jgi:bis(5'-nucleosyl)-tetraphosphatase (symmetrical)
VATWVIGDIHGCWQTLQRLLDAIRWDPAIDRLWLVGDLVNRGPSSLQVLRWAVEHDARITAVLGNHDLHLLARARGLRPARAEDRLDEVMAADDRDDLLDWLRHRPLLHRENRTLMVHAGLLPRWSVDEAERIARDVARGVDRLLPSFSAKPKPVWTRDLEGDERLAAAAAVLTLMRVVDADDRPRFGFSGSPADAPGGCRPWYEAAQVLNEGFSVIFGHWAMLGFHRREGMVCMDSGCVYGGSLTALCLDDGRVVDHPLVDPVGE